MTCLALQIIISDSYSSMTNPLPDEVRFVLRFVLMFFRAFAGNGPFFSARNMSECGTVLFDDHGNEQVVVYALIMIVCFVGPFLVYKGYREIYMPLARRIRGSVCECRVDALPTLWCLEGAAARGHPNARSKMKWRRRRKGT